MNSDGMSLERWTAAREEADRLIKEKHSKDPRYILWDLVKKLKIKIDPSTNKYELNPNYSIRYPEEDFSKIMKVIRNAQSDGNLPQKNEESPIIVAIQPRLGLPPQLYYIRNDVSEWRKKKSTKAKPKRKPVKKCKCK